MAMCDIGTVFNTAISQSKPLVNYKSKRLVGILGSFVEKLIRSCCNTNGTVNISRITEHPQDLLMSISDDEHIILPYTEVNSMKYNIEDSFVLPVLSSPGAVFLVDVENESTSMNIGNILAVTWQLLLIIIISCGFAGAIIWLLDTLQNPNTFPRSFHKGFWEGLWWAFISMTTVGYGDLTPKSVFGRIFAMVWILLGICIIAVFTAALTAALTSVDNNRNTIQGRRVGVLNGTDECHLAALLGAEPVAFNSIKEMLDALQSDEHGTLEGILLDNAYVADVFSSDTKRDLRMMIQVSSQRIHGILFQSINSNLLECFKKEGRKSQFDDKMMKPLVMKKHPNKNMLNKIQGSETMYSWLYTKVLYIIIYAALLVVLFMVLLLWEFVYWRPKQIPVADQNNQSAGSEQSGKINQTMKCNNCRSVIDTIS